MNRRTIDGTLFLLFIQQRLQSPKKRDEADEGSDVVVEELVAVQRIEIVADQKWTKQRFETGEEAVQAKKNWKALGSKVIDVEQRPEDRDDADAKADDERANLDGHQSFEVWQNEEARQKRKLAKYGHVFEAYVIFI